MGAGFTGMQDHVSFTMDEQTLREKSGQVPLSVVKGMVLNGTVDDVLDQAAEWRDHGVRYIVVVNFGPMAPSLRTGLASLLPVQQGGPRPQAAVISARYTRRCSVALARRNRTLRA